MILHEPKVEVISKTDNDIEIKIISTRAVNKFISAIWKSEKNYDDTKSYSTYHSTYQDVRELNVVIPVNCIGKLKEGYYEYDEYKNACPGLAAHVKGPNEDYVAQNMGGSGDSEYPLLKCLCDFESGLFEAEWYLECSGNWVHTLKEGTTNEYESHYVPVLCPSTYFNSLIPDCAYSELVLKGTKEDFESLCNLDIQDDSDIRYILKKIRTMI